MAGVGDCNRAAAVCGTEGYVTCASGRPNRSNIVIRETLFDVIFEGRANAQKTSAAQRDPRVQSTASAKITVRSELEPAAYFFNTTFAEPNKVCVYPAAFRAVVGGFLVDSGLKLEGLQRHRLSSQSDDCAGSSRTGEDDRKITCRTSLVSAKIYHRTSLI